MSDKWEMAHNKLHKRIDLDAKELSNITSKYSKRFNSVLLDYKKNFGELQAIPETIPHKKANLFKQELKSWLQNPDIIKDKQFTKKIIRTINLKKLNANHFLELNFAKIASDIRIKHHGKIINSLYNTFLDSEKAVARITNVTFTKAGDDIIYNAINKSHVGHTIDFRMLRNSRKDFKKMMKLLYKEILNGTSIKSLYQTAKFLMSKGDYKARAILITESTRINSEAKQIAFKKANIKYYQYISVMDDKTSPACIRHDLKIYRVEDMRIGENAPPLHINCRASIRPYYIIDA